MTFSYIKLDDGKVPIILFNNTGFGSAKEGFPLTDTPLYWHNMLESAKYINYAYIYSVEFKKKAILINGEEIRVDLLDKKKVEQVAPALSSIFL